MGAFLVTPVFNDQPDFKTKARQDAGPLGVERPSFRS